MIRATITGVFVAIGIISAITISEAASVLGIQITTKAQAMYQSVEGTTMPTAVSNTVSLTVTPPIMSIGSAKLLEDGDTVQIQDSVVTAGTDTMGGAFYIESSDRSAGIRVDTTQTALEGSMVAVAGAIGTVNGERLISASNVQIISSGNTLPKPLGTAQRSVTAGPDNSGLLVRVWGQITAVPGSGYFYVDDGSALNDGTGSVGIRIRGTAPSSPVGKYVMVNGVSALEMQGTLKIRVIRARRPSDVSVLGAAP